MFARHVVKDLSAYCNGELQSDEARQVAEHMIACNRCRERYEEIKFGVNLAEQLPQLTAPDSLWLNIENRLAAATTANAPARHAGFFPLTGWQRTLAWSLTAAVIAAGIAFVWMFSRESRPSWSVERVAGAPRVGSSAIDQKGRLAVGQWLETDSNSRAKLDVASIGQVEVDPNTRIRLVETKPTEHRLELARGRMSAVIWAPPRLFFVNTPSAVAADLGCAYSLEVDDDGRGELHVTLGWVALQLGDRESMVPAGASCETRPGLGPGTPYFDDASEDFRHALSRIDFASSEPTKISDLDLVLRDARSRDTLTLWHLLARVEGNDRGRVYERMAALMPPPAGVTREGVLHLNEQMLQAWKDKLAETWGSSAGDGGKGIQLVKKAFAEVSGSEEKR